MLVIDLIVGAGAAKTAKRSRSSRKGKRALSSCAVPSPKQPKLLKEEGKVRFWVITSAEREVKDSRRSGMYQSYNFLTRLGKQSL